MNHMTSTEIKLVQNTWGMIRPIASDAVELFYNRLFLLDPELRRLFPRDMTEQKKHLGSMITLVVAGLEQPERVVTVVRQLGIRHIGYSARSKDYDTVGEALLWTLSLGLGSAFTPEVEAAWTKVYTLLATLMQEAAAEAMAQEERRYDYAGLKFAPFFA